MLHSIQSKVQMANRTQRIQLFRKRSLLLRITHCSIIGTTCGFGENQSLVINLILLFHGGGASNSVQLEGHFH